MVKKKISVQPVINIGLVGHVDHGKTTMTERLSGKWADTHSEEIKRGITIRLGYANTTFYKCSKCKGAEAYSVKPKCVHCGGNAVELRKISLVDAPGHETLMATMMSGSAIMDCAILLIAANEKCPQPQTKEHLMALEISDIKNIIIVQNKIDLVSELQAKNNYNQIKKFVKGTIAENAPIIPISAQLSININYLIQAIEENFPTPKRDLTKSPMMLTARSFDVNKPGTKIKKLVGGVLGGSLIEGQLKVGEEIEIKPGRKIEKEGKTTWEPITTKIIGIMTGKDAIDSAVPGGSIALLTELDPAIVKSDSLAGNVVGHIGKLPSVWIEFELKPTLLKKVVGISKDLVVEPIKKGEPLMLNVNASVTAGVVNSISKNSFKITLKRPICVQNDSRITLSRLLEHRFRLIGYATIKD
jgi:translation initiation factor 2 subunit 3